MKFLDLLNKIISFIEKRVPWLLLGYHLGKSKEARINKENIELNLKLRNLADEVRIKDHNEHLTNDELRAEVLGWRSKNRSN